ncbi:MAG: phosphoglycerate kinase [Patescibacteria group bacterium]|nr:phosphoglycerate kinase [Patescibacteria group bacterium]MCL5261895.1 phosphoglycerate kinase [Patescibacteria group bacterium]
MIAILRINLDIEPDEFPNSLRLRLAITEINRLLKHYEKIVILSHRGRPNGRDKRMSLLPAKKFLEAKLKKTIVFFDGFNFSELRSAVRSSKERIFMLENLRFLKGECANDSGLAKSLASLGDVFINDDFASSHRKNASISGIAKFAKRSILGEIVKSEIKHLDTARGNPRKPLAIIVGGAKISDKLGVIKRLIGRAEYVLTGGGAANTFLKASGIPTNGSLVEEDMVSEAKKLLKSGKIVVPADYRRQRGDILDIGPETEKIYSDIIIKAKTIIWAGPLGYIEKPEFAKGSAAILKAITKSKARAIIGGGETTAFALKKKFKKQNGFLSTGGGAMLEYLAGNKMPGIEIADKK